MVRRRDAPLSEAEFCREVLRRLRSEAPAVRARPMGACLLLLETAHGERRIVSLSGLYQSYVADQPARDALIAGFLAQCLREEPPAIRGDFAANRGRVLPQIVPPSLVEFCRRGGRSLVAMPFPGGLSVAFVVDEPERYCYIGRRVARLWKVRPLGLLAAALENLARISRDVTWQQVGTGDGAVFVTEQGDGYDASRILLTRWLVGLESRVAGQVVLAIPHRDCLLAWGDRDPDLTVRMQARVERLFATHGYPISPLLFTLEGGRVVPYRGSRPAAPN